MIESLYNALGMLWMIFWALALGFLISGAVQAFVSKKRMAALLGRPSLKSLSFAAFFGAMSSSCSYAAASMAKSIFQKGAHIIPSLAFMLASTNLVIELSVVLWVMLGWQFVLAEFLGGVILILLMAALMRAFAPLKIFEQKQKELSRHKVDAEHEKEHVEETADPYTWDGWIQAAHAFVMEVRMIWKDVLIGVLVSGFLMTFVPASFWQSLFLGSASGAVLNWSKILENAFIGPLVAMLSFVCSVGNIPLASVLFHGGISFGGAISFIYGDLIVIPLILIYRKYYGWKLALWIAAIFYLSMAITGVIVDVTFTLLGWVPRAEHMHEQFHSPKFFEINYTFWLNLLFLAITVVLIVLARKTKLESESHCCH